MGRQQPQEHRAAHKPAGAARLLRGTRQDRSCASTTNAAVPARPSAPGTVDAVDHAVEHSAAAVSARQDFRGRHVLALPAVGFADAVHEIIEAALVAAHQVAGAIPRIPWLEHIAQYLARGRFGIRVAFEAAGKLIVRRRVSAPRPRPLRWPRSVRSSPSALRQRLAAVDIESQQCHRQAVREEATVSSRWRPAVPRSCRARNFLRSTRSTRESAES